MSSQAPDIALTKASATQPANALSMFQNATKVSRMVMTPKRDPWALEPRAAPCRLTYIKALTVIIAQIRMAPHMGMFAVKGQV